MRTAQSRAWEEPDRELIAGRYRVEAALGHGGAAHVLKVMDVSRGRSLALKRLAWSAKPRLVRQFELEYRTLASLKHPRIVEVFEYGRDEAGAFYTMELLDGEDLRDRAPISWREACAYLRDAAEALSLLHARRLVHRDVNPRNLWRCPDGTVKLIDFGALTPFGPVDHLMGTPPFIPPEALHGQDLDQRADLYSMGALAYYLLTGIHAYRASEPRELPELWQFLPALPSACVAELGRDDLEAVPAELDELVMALLSQSALARPRSAAEVIDRLDVMLGGARRAQSELGEIHLSNATLVGRERELRSLRRRLLLASRGRGQCCVIEGEAGLGRSRLLHELELLARVTEVGVLRVDAAHLPGAYAVAGALGVKLLEALPEVARAAAEPHAALLAHSTPQLRERLGATPARVRRFDGDLGMRIQSALRDWFLAVAKQRPLVILVDGLELIDVGSAAFLLALALELKQAPIFLVTTLAISRARERTVAERELLKASKRVQLRPLDDDQMLALTESVFGRVEHVARLTSHLQHSVRGNPGHLLDLCRKLLHRNVIGFVAGSWVLPLDIPEDALAGTRNEALLQRLSLLSPQARAVGRALSMHSELISPALCRILVGAVSEELFVKLGELLEHEVLVQELDGVRFTHDELRRALNLELSPEESTHLRRVLGDHLLAQPDATPLDRLRAGVHLFAAGDARGPDVVSQASRAITLSEGVKLNAAVADLEEALRLLRAAGRPSDEQLCVLVPLAIAGYRVHRRYALRHGEATVTALEALLGLDLARKLRPRLGARLSALAGLAFGAASERIRPKNPRSLSFKNGVGLLFNTVAALSASSGLSLDVPAARRYARVLEPFSVFGTKQAAGFTHEYCRILAESCSDRPGQTYREFTRLLQRLEKPIRGVSRGLLAHYLNGVLVTMGALEAQSEGKQALQTAQRLAESPTSSGRLSAEQILGLYYAHQGNVAMFERSRQRAEHAAIQQGATWQVEAWATGASTAMYMRIHDAMGMKQACEQLERLSEDMPSLEVHVRRARGAYLLMRGRYREALPVLAECLLEEPRTIAGWARAMGSLARAHNRLGEHAAARDVCLRVTRGFDPDDPAYTAFHLLAQTELLISEAGLGRAELARQGIAELLSRHGADGGPLTLGEVHEAGLEIELLLGDRERAEGHLRELRRWYLATNAPSLAQRCETLAKLVTAPGSVSDQRARGTDAGAELSLTGISTTRGLNAVDRRLAGGSMSLSERFRTALQILVDECQGTSGALYLFDGGTRLRLFADLNQAGVEPEVEAWLHERMDGEILEEVTQLVETDEVPSDTDHDLLQHGERAYRVVVLTAMAAATQQVIGAALVASHAPPSACPRSVVHSVSHHMRRALQQAHTTG